MYLLHAPSVVNSRILKLEWVPDERVQKYAILSHRWRTEQGQEVTYTDSQVYPWRWRHKVWMKKLGAAKLSLASKQACTDGLDYIWIDTCCIDKSSSQELQESLESMYNWYQGAEVCYVYLSDVPRRNLEDSRWFKRGWTLQELIAPRHSIFFDSTWKRLATKASLAKIISNITGVNAGLLRRSRQLDEFTIAQRLSWAANRQTTRVEDRAYSLFGILDVSIIPKYGEGLKAFQRLQEEIIQRSTDHSILAWYGWNELSDIFATSPDDFAKCGHITRRRYFDGRLGTFQINNVGLTINVDYFEQEDSGYDKYGHAVLNCRDDSSARPIISLGVFAPGEEPGVFYVTRPFRLEQLEEMRTLGKAQQRTILIKRHRPEQKSREVRTELRLQFHNSDSQNALDVLEHYAEDWSSRGSTFRQQEENDATGSWTLRLVHRCYKIEAPILAGVQLRHSSGEIASLLIQARSKRFGANARPSKQLYGPSTSSNVRMRLICNKNSKQGLENHCKSWKNNNPSVGSVPPMYTSLRLDKGGTLIAEVDSEDAMDGEAICVIRLATMSWVRYVYSILEQKARFWLACDLCGTILRPAEFGDYLSHEQQIFSFCLGFAVACGKFHPSHWSFWPAVVSGLYIIRLPYNPESRKIEGVFNMVSKGLWFGLKAKMLWDGSNWKLVGLMAPLESFYFRRRFRIKHYVNSRSLPARCREIFPLLVLMLCWLKLH